MKKRRPWGNTFCFLMALVMLCTGLALPAAADMGPKPSVEVLFQGLEGERYQVTLLSDRVQYGPWSAKEDYQDWMGDQEALKPSRPIRRRRAGISWESTRTAPRRDGLCGATIPRRPFMCWCGCRMPAAICAAASR